MKKKIILLTLCVMLFASSLNIKVIASEYKSEPNATVALEILKHVAKINIVDSNNLYWLDHDYDSIISSEDALIVLQKAAKIYSPIILKNNVDAVSDEAVKLEVNVLDIIKISSQEEHGIFMARSVADYHAFIKSLKKPIKDIQSEYFFDETFFEDKSLIIVVTNKGSSDIMLAMNNVYRDRDTLQISYSIIQPELPSLGLTAHLILIEVDDADIYGVNDLAEHVIWEYQK